MSRRARLEDEKLAQLNNELKEEEDKIKQQQERIFAPLVWRQLNSGIKIQDLKPIYFDSVLEIVKEHYFLEEVLCRNTNLQEDSESVESFTSRLIFSLRDKTSLIALDEMKENAIAGFMITRVIHRETFDRVFSRAKLVNGEAHKKCVEFTGHLNRKADVFTAYDCEKYLQFYLICILPEYRKKGLGLKLMQCGIDLARTLDIDVVMGVFSSWKLQKLAKINGMKVVYEVNYIQWKNNANEMIFDEPGVGNYTCAVMAGRVPPLPPPPPVQVADVLENAAKMTREEKRKAKAKAKAKHKS